MAKSTLGKLIMCGLSAVAGLAFLWMFGLSELRSRGQAVFAEGRGRCVVIDAGHGLPDAGAVGASGTMEEELNLQIAERLAAHLEGEGYEVVMTREDHQAIGSTKDADMVERRRIISDSGQDVTVSIHQNIYAADSSVCGAQVFFAPGSAEGERLAGIIQAELNAELKPEKPRSEHVGNYYIVKSGSPPAVIIECGFISNPEEESLLKKSQYQVRIIKAIERGIKSYLSA